MQRTWSDTGMNKENLVAALFFALFIISLGFDHIATEKQPPTTIELDGMARIPAGKFIMGSNKVDTEMLQQRFGLDDIPYLDEHPERKVHLGEYYIDIYEVTNKQYKAFLDDIKEILPEVSYAHTKPVSWEEGAYPEDKGSLPVNGISWGNAKAYCAWKGKRLPTEAEWEKAARGTDGREFPWGNEFDDKKTNSMGLHGGTVPVGQFKGDVSPYGVHDMAGNICEWVDDWYKSYPGNDFQSDKFGENLKVVRGWYWGGIGHYIMDMFYRSASRAYMRPEEALEEVGFRCAYSTTPSSTNL